MTQEDIEKCITDLKVVQAETLSSLKSCHKRLNKIENIVDGINNLAISIETIALEIKAMREELNKLDLRVGELEEKPAKHYEIIVGAFVTSCIGALIGIFFSRLNIW